MKPVEVIWVDIEELAGGWHDQDDVDEHIHNVEARTVKMLGYLLEQDEETITLVDSMMGTKYYGTVNVIPRGCIKSIREL